MPSTTERQNILGNINKYVKEELERDNIPTDAKYVIVGTINNDGTKILGAVNIHRSDKVNTQVAAVWDHDWDGDDTVGAKIIFVGK